MVDRIAEMIAARQAPGMVVRKNVRSGVLYGQDGRQVRTIFGGETQDEAVGQLVQAAEDEGIDTATARIRLTEEAGQGVGKNQQYGRRSRKLRPTKATVKQGTPRL